MLVLEKILKIYDSLKLILSRTSFFNFMFIIEAGYQRFVLGRRFILRKVASPVGKRRGVGNRLPTQCKYFPCATKRLQK